MHRMFLIIVICASLSACDTKPDYGIDYKTSERITVLVSYFERNSSREDLEQYRVGLTDMFITELEKIPQLQVVQRSRLDAIMSESELAEVGLVDPTTAQKVGRLVGAQALYKGSFTTFGKMMRLDGHLVRLETYEVISAGEDTCKIDDKDVFKMVGRQAKIIAAKIRANHKKLIADSFYSKGRTAEEENDIDSAIRHYRKAVQYYDKHELGWKALKHLQP